MVGAGVYAILVTETLGALGSFMVVPTLPFFAMQLGADAFGISLLMPAFYVAQTFCSPAVGALSDRVGRKRVLLIGCVAQAFGNVLLSRCTSLQMLLMVNFARGILMSTSPVELAYIMEDAENEQELGKALLMQRLFVSCGAISGPLVAGFLNSWAFRDLCHALVGINVLNLLISIFFLRDSKQPKEGVSPASVGVSPASVGGSSAAASPSRRASPEGALAELWALARGRTTATLLSLWFLSSCAGGIIEGPEIVFLKDHFSFGRREACHYFIIAQLTSICFASFMHPLIHGAGRVRGIGPLTSCVSGAIGSATSALLLVSLPGFVWLPYVYGSLVAGVFGSMFQVGFMHLVQKTCSRNTLGSLLGLVSALGSAGVTLGPPIGGLIYGLNSYGTYVVGAMLLYLTGVLFSALLAGEAHEKQPLQMEKEPSLRRAATPFHQPVVLDKSFATRIAVNELVLDMDPDLYAVYQAYREMIGQEAGLHGTLPRNFTVAGHHIVSPALRQAESVDAIPRATRSKTMYPGVLGSSSYRSAEEAPDTERV